MGLASGVGRQKGTPYVGVSVLGPEAEPPASLQQVAILLPHLSWAQRCDFLVESQNLGSKTRTYLRSASHLIQAGCADSCS